MDTNDIEMEEKKQVSLRDTSDAFTWDVVIVFKVGTDKKISIRNRMSNTVDQVEEKQAFSEQAAEVVESIKNAGLKVLLYKSIQKDEIYCLIGASEDRLKHEANRSNYDLLLDGGKAIDKGVEYGMKLAKATVSEDPKFSAFTRQQWEGLYGAYNKDPTVQDLYKRYATGNPANPSSLFRPVDRLRLTAAVIKNDKEIGGAGINIDSAMKAATHPMVAYFCLDNEAAKQDLANVWITWNPFQVFNQPLDKIRNYYGESVALYFAFIQYYSVWLVLPAFLGIIGFLYQLSIDTMDTPYNPIYAVAVAGWASLFLEAWKRRNSVLNTRWGMNNFLEKETNRPGFEGEYQPSPIHGADEEIFDFPERVKRLVFGQTVIWSLITIVLGCVASIFILRQFLLKNLDQVSGPIVAGLVNAVQIQILNIVYGLVAEKLNEYENHKTQTAFEDALIAKGFLFKFINSYNSIFYICFIKAYDVGCALSHGEPDCLGEVRLQLVTIFGTNLLVNNTIEIVTPLIKARQKAAEESKGLTEEQKKLITEPEKQYEKAPYESTLSDFDELAIQFGYASLFVLAFPIAPLLALINNYFEIRLDSSKLLMATRRPEPRGASTIGTWFTIFNIIGFIAVITNCGIIIFVSPDTIHRALVSAGCRVPDPILDPRDNITHLWETQKCDHEEGIKFVIFLILEHFLFLVKFVIDFAVPDVPNDIQEHLERQNYICAVLLQGLNDPHADDEDAKRKSVQGTADNIKQRRVAEHYNFESIADTFNDTAHLDVYKSAEESKEPQSTRALLPNESSA